MENSNISWTDDTFNPWIGCTKISDGCKYCYAETLMDKRYGKVKWGPQGIRKRTSDDYWRKPLAWNHKAEREGVRRRVFCASLADVFEDRPEVFEWRADLFGLIDATPNLDWLLLTKRPENIKRLWPLGWYDEQFTWPNIWIGTSIENQEMANKRIPELLRIPAAVRFLSVEPLLEPVDLSGFTMDTIWIDQEFADNDPHFQRIIDEDGWPIHWVIVGGESGPGARSMQPEWVRSIRDQCVAADVPFFFKQWGGTKKIDGVAGGHELDGQVWHEWPMVTA